MPTDHVPLKRTYVLSEIVPFGARFTFERIACDLGNWEPDPNAGTGEDEDQGEDEDDVAVPVKTVEAGSDRSKDGKRDYIRILIK